MLKCILLLSTRQNLLAVLAFFFINTGICTLDPCLNWLLSLESKEGRGDDF